MHSLSIEDWLALAAYLAMLVVIALRQRRLISGAEDLYLAGRSMSRWPVAMSMYVALFSSNTFIGAIGWLNRKDGTVWIGLQNIGIILAVPLVIALFPNIFFRLRITTAYEYLERRFNYPVRALASALFLSARIMWMATILYGGSLVISQMTGLAAGLPAAMVVLAIVGTALAMIGGMRAIIWTDVAQFFVLFGSVLLMLVLAVTRSGGITHVIAAAAAAHRFDPPPLFSLTSDLSVLSGLSLGIVSMLSSAGTDQVVLQTYLTARNVKEARGSLWFNGIFLKPLSLIFPALGMIIFVYFREHPADAALLRMPDDALPVFILQVLPPGARGLAIAGIMAAMLTSYQGGLAALSACVQVDYLRHFRSEPLSEAASVRLGRALMLTWSIVSLIAAFGVLRLGKSNSIIQILNIVMYPFTGVLLGIFLLGMLTRRTAGGPALAGAIGGMLVSLYIPLSGVVISNFYFGMIATGVTFFLGYACSFFCSVPNPHQIEGLTHAPAPALQVR